MFVVAYGLTMNVPWATPGETIEQVGDVIRLVSNVPGAGLALYDKSIQPESEGDKPVPRKLTVDSSDELVADRIRVLPEETTARTLVAKSPALGAQPRLPRQPVISITY